MKNATTTATIKEFFEKKGFSANEENAPCFALRVDLKEKGSLIFVPYEEGDGISVEYCMPIRYGMVLSLSGEIQVNYALARQEEPFITCLSVAPGAVSFYGFLNGEAPVEKDLNRFLDFIENSKMGERIAKGRGWLTYPIVRELENISEAVSDDVGVEEIQQAIARIRKLYNEENAVPSA